ncbi:MAG: zinc ribbon domain-containing protein [Planctomycetaceae bacterium]|nr:zinc ribbon domain-containing protein [Planctomycetales bacterium]MCB9872607.1 zinc ribbon domain-containing protein [Planctomycetaceae bacterium]MCB9939567.1 zinc ribbon domain-containing protein [Planctomycetaceae bacterium]HRX81557.1 zinc ribbon domain-containing protein [Pirellulaceae bacterium]
MPTYDYECDACGHTFELFQTISEPVKKKCPECKKQKLRRLFGTGAAVMFKGSGFYTTDYRSDSYKKAAEADKKSTSDSSSKSESKSSESKSSDASSKSDSTSTSKSPKSDS